MSNQAITESTNVRLGLVLSLFAFGVGSIWWAASVQTKMDALLISVNECTLAIKASSATTTALQSELRVMDATGTKKCIELVKEVDTVKQRIQTLENKK